MNRTIMLIEDTRSNQILIEDMFELDGMGAELVTFAAAEPALEQVARLKPALVLMDLALPGMDGLEAVRRIKADPATRDTHIWAVTAHAMKGDKKLAIAAGCEAYFTKPLDIASLAARVREFLCGRVYKEVA